MPISAGQGDLQVSLGRLLQLRCRDAFEAKLVQSVKERAATQDTLQSLREDLQGATEEKAALSSEYDSLKDMLEALRGERAKFAEALEASEARLATTEAQHTQQAERSERLQQELAAAVASREVVTDQKLAELEGQLLGATLQHKDLSRQHETAQQGSRNLQAELEQEQSAHQELLKRHGEAQDTIDSLREKVAGLTKDKEGLVHELSDKDAMLKEAAEAADRAQEEAETQITEAARRAAEEGEAHRFRVKNFETDLRSSKTQIEELEALLKASEASESVLKAKLATAQSKVVLQTQYPLSDGPLALASPTLICLCSCNDDFQVYPGVMLLQGVP